MSRSLCEKCQFIEVDCICHHIHNIDNRTHIIVLQHRSEQKNAKNTIRLASMLYQKVTVLIGDKNDDFTELNHLPLDTTALLYPSDNASKLDTNNPKQNLTHLIVLDGTWKKANKLFFTVDVLKQLQQVSFEQLPENQYHLRKANRSDSLSSLEAIAYALQCLEELAMKPAYQALNAMMENQFKYMPADVRARYKSK